MKRDGRKAGEDVFLDFENAQPTAEEQEVYDKVKAVLDQSVSVLTGTPAFFWGVEGKGSGFDFNEAEYAGASAAFTRKSLGREGVAQLAVRGPGSR